MSNNNVIKNFFDKVKNNLLEFVKNTQKDSKNEIKNIDIFKLWTIKYGLNVENSNNFFSCFTNESIEEMYSVFVGKILSNKFTIKPNKKSLNNLLFFIGEWGSGKTTSIMKFIYSNTEKVEAIVNLDNKIGSTEFYKKFFKYSNLKEIPIYSNIKDELKKSSSLICVDIQGGFHGEQQLNLIQNSVNLNYCNFICISDSIKNVEFFRNLPILNKVKHFSSIITKFDCLNNASNNFVLMLWLSFNKIPILYLNHGEKFYNTIKFPEGYKKTEYKANKKQINKQFNLKVFVDLMCSLKKLNLSEDSQIFELIKKYVGEVPNNYKSQFFSFINLANEYKIIINSLKPLEYSFYNSISPKRLKSIAYGSGKSEKTIKELFNSFSMIEEQIGKLFNL